MTRTATFSKLRNDEWGIRVAGPLPDVGEAVEVSKRDGSTKTVYVARVLWNDDSASLCAISEEPVEASAPNNPSEPPPVSAPPLQSEPRDVRAPSSASARITPTEEQKGALDLFMQGRSMAIEAGAGTGKTSTLLLLADAVPNEQVQYVAFNAKIVEDSAKKFGRNVSCNTAHSLAMRAIGKPFMPRLRASKRVKSTELATMLRIEPLTVTTWTGEAKRLGAPFLAGLAMKAIERFCMSADPEPNSSHVPHVKNLDAPATGERPASYEVNNEVGRHLEPTLRRAWKDLCQFDGALPFKHSHYLKMWQLNDPRIDARVILFDEAQDASPVMVDIVRQNAERGTQVVWVGDSQQEIYAWAGAVNALANVPADSRCFLTQSFRFGDAVAEVANRCLTDLCAQLRLRGFDKIQSRVEPIANPTAILCRTNAAAVREMFRYIEDGKVPFLVGGGTEIVRFARGAQDLMTGRLTTHPELACFDSWNEVKMYVEEDEQGEDLRLLVKLIEEFGVDKILNALDPKNLSAEAEADVVISTAHKSKGCEWDSVQLAGDFKDEMEGEELRLLYVAVTRAKLVLDITLVGYLNDSDDAEGELDGSPEAIAASRS